MTSGTSPTATPKKGVSFVGVPPTIDRSARLPPYQSEEYDAIVIRMRALFKECTDACAQEKESGKRVPMEVVKQLNAEMRTTLEQLDQLPDQEPVRVRVAKVVLCRLGMWFCISRCVSAAGRYAKQILSIRDTFPPAPEGVASFPWWQKTDEWELLFKQE